MPSRNLGTLTLDLIAKIGGFEQGMDRAARVSKDRMDKIQKSAKAAGLALSAIGAIAGAYGLTLARAAIDSADALSKQSKAVGIAVEDLGALNYAAELSGVSVEEVSASMNKFNRSVGEAIDGTGAGADAFEQLGVSAKSADGSIKSNIDLLRELSDKFAGMADGAQKSALAQDLFGRSGTKLIPLLNGGSQGLADMADEAQRLGLIMDSETAAAAEQFNDNLTRLQKSADAFGVEVAKDMLPALTRITNAMIEAKKESGLLYALWVGLGGVAGELVGLDEVADQIKDIDDNLAELRERLDGAQSRQSSDFWQWATGQTQEEANAQVEALKASISELEEERRKLLSPAKKPSSGGSTTQGPEGPSKEFAKREAALRKEIALFGEVGKAAQLRYEIENGLIEGLNKGEAERLLALTQELESRENTKKAIEEQQRAIEQLTSAYDSQLETYMRQIALTGEATELERVRYEIANGNLVGINAAQQRRIEGLAAEIDKLAELKQAEEDRKKLQDEVDGLTNSLLTENEAALQRYIDSMNVLNEAQRQDITILGGYDDASRRVWERYQEDVKKAGEATDELSVFADQAARNMQDAFADFLFDPFEDGLDGMLKSFGQILQRMIAEAAAAQIFDAVLGKQGAGGSRSGGLLDTGLAALGAYFGAHDAGGFIPAGGWGIAGEKGPEIVRGPAHVTSRADTAKMMGGSSVSIGNMNFPNVTNAQEARRAAGAAAREISRVFVGSGRYA